MLFKKKRLSKWSLCTTGKHIGPIMKLVREVPVVHWPKFIESRVSVELAVYVLNEKKIIRK